MSTSRVYNCLERFTCRVTNRGKKVFKSAGIGFVAGATSGATIGGVAVGFTDLGYYMSGASDFYEKNKDDYVKYPEVCTTWTDRYKGRDHEHKSCTRAELNRDRDNFGLQYAKEKIAETGPIIALACTAGGALIGFFAGACHGWNAELTQQEVEEDLEAQKQPEVAFARLG